MLCLRSLFDRGRLEQALEVIAHLIAKGSQLTVTHRIGVELGLSSTYRYRQPEDAQAAKPPIAHECLERPYMSRGHVISQARSLLVPKE